MNVGNAASALASLTAPTQAQEPPKPASKPADDTAATALEKERRAKARTDLDAKLNFSKQPKVELALITAGVLSDDDNLIRGGGLWFGRGGIVNFARANDAPGAGGRGDRPNR